MSRRDPVPPGTETCGCCEGVERVTPEAIANRPGLRALRHRVGTHASFLESMIAALSTTSVEAPVEGDPEAPPRALRPLHGLRTRERNDPAIALLDAWATVADVLTFYQERIANEGFLRVATERRSLLELARLVGHEPRPGVSASAHLAFTLDEGSAGEIPRGTKVQSTPAREGELPQTFETAQPLEARAEWSGLKPRRTRPQTFRPSRPEDPWYPRRPLYLAGFVTSLKVGAGLLVDEQLHRVMKIEQDAEQSRTTVFLLPWRGEEAEAPRAGRIRRAAVSGEPTPAERKLVQAATAEVSRIAARFRNLDAFEVERGEMAERVLDVLAALEADAEASAAPEELAARLRERLARLGRFRASAARFARLGPWLRDMVAELEAPEERLLHDRGHVLGDVIAALRRPPSRPSPYPFVPELEASYGAASALGLDLLGALHPSLREKLPAAWKNVALAPEPTLRAHATQAAGVFARLAQPKPVFDKSGSLIGFEDHPLVGESELRVHFQSGAILFALTEGDDSAAAQLRFSDMVETDSGRRGQAPLGDGRIVVDFEMDLEREQGRYLLRFESGERQAREIEVAFAFVSVAVLAAVPGPAPSFQGSIAVRVSVDGSEPRTVQPGTTRSFRADDARVELALDERQQLAIRVRSGLPVSGRARSIAALDAVYEGVLPGHAVVVDRPGRALERFDVRDVAVVSESAFGVSARVTQLTLDRPWLGDADRMVGDVRSATFHLQHEPLELAEEPIFDVVAGDRIPLDALHQGLEPGRLLIVSGERADVRDTEGVKAAELAVIAGVTHELAQRPDAKQVAAIRRAVSEGGSALRDVLPGEKLHTVVTLANPLAYRYARDTVTIHGNVVEATHGETRAQVLGSGDGSRPRQQFRLAFAPLTYLPAPSPAGVESTLEVRVDEVAWRATANPAAPGPGDRVYLTRTDDDDAVTVLFGDGRRGARPSTGVENVTAAYRQGLGKAGNVAAGQLNLLISRPLGVRGVANPLPATGGADRDGRDALRRNAPLPTLALDRLVSVRDYADFARSFAAIGKASARRLSDGRRELVHLSVAGVDDVPIAPSSLLYDALVGALRAAGDPHQPFRVAVRELKLLVISAGLRVAAGHRFEVVEPRVRAAVLEAFGFARRELGQDAVLSRLLQVVQSVPGVAYVDVDVFDAIGEDFEPADLAGLAAGFARRRRIVAELDRAERDAGRVALRPAQLVVLAPDVPETLLLREIR